MAATPLAFSRRVGTNVSSSSNTTLVITPTNSFFTLPEHAGNPLVLYIAWSSITVNITSVTDSKGNTWVVEPVVTGTAQRGTIAVCLDPLRLTAQDTVTITFSAAVTNKAAALCEFLGVKATGTPRDGDTANSGAGTSGSSQTVTGTALTSTVNDDILFAVVFTNQAAAADTLTASGWTQTGSEIHAASGISLYPAFKVLSATGTETFSGTVSGGGTLTRAWGVGVYAFKISDTSAPRTSSVIVEVDKQGERRATSAIVTEVDVQGARRATSSIVVEVDAGFSHVATSSILVEADVVIPAATPRRPNPMFVG